MSHLGGQGPQPVAQAVAGQILTALGAPTTAETSSSISCFKLWRTISVVSSPDVLLSSSGANLEAAL